MLAFRVVNVFLIGWFSRWGYFGGSKERQIKAIGDAGELTCQLLLIIYEMKC